MAYDEKRAARLDTLLGGRDDNAVKGMLAAWGLWRVYGGWQHGMWYRR